MLHKQGLWVRQQAAAPAGAEAQQQAPPDRGSASSGGGSGRGGSSRQELLASRRSVAACLVRLGCDSQAAEHLEEVLAGRRADVVRLQPPPPPALDASSAGAADGAGDVDWSILADGDARLSKQQQEGLLSMAAVAEDLAAVRSRLGAHGAAEELFWAALEARSQVLGARHELVQATEEQLRACLDRQC